MQRPDISAKLIDPIFSVHFVVERDLTVHTLSETLRRYMPFLDGKPLLEKFKVMRPESLVDFDSIMSTAGKMVLLEASDNSFAIRGQFAVAENEKLCRFVGAPWLAWMSKNQPTIKMKLRDFSASDPQLDQLILLSTERQNLKDLELLASEIKEAHQKTKISYKAQADFFAIMSHEMRTPLNGVSMALELIDTNALDDESKRMHAIATHSANNLKNVINSVLDYSKLQSGGFSNDPIPFNITETLEAAMTMIEAKATQNNVSLVGNIDNQLTSAVIGDEPKIRQVLINLLSNAIKFTSDGSITVSITLANEETELLFTVEDTGLGIADHIKPHVFKPFWTIEEDKTAIGAGTGLGLNICHQMIDIMGGHIEFSSTINVGTKFTFGIPVEKTNISPQRKYEYGQTDNPLFEGTILLAEDNKINQQLMTRILEKRGISVDVVDNGKQAVDQVQEKQYDLVFMDISMPVMDGIEATKILRKSYDQIQLPIVALTAHAGQDKAGEYLDTGMNAVMNKPIDGSALNLILGQWLSSSTQGIVSTSEENSITDISFELIDTVAAEKLIADIGVSVYQDIASMFEAECRKSIDKITAEYNDLNFDDVGKTAHAILSSARSLGVEKLGQHLKKLELAAMDANTSDMNILISTLEQLNQDSLTALEKYAGSLPN